MKTFQLYGRIYKVLATFPESEKGKANEYMEANQETGCLAIDQGLVIIAALKDKGVPA